MQQVSCYFDLSVKKEHGLDNTLVGDKRDFHIEQRAQPLEFGNGKDYC